MDIATTRDYIAHRLQHVGGTGREFTAEATRCIFEESGGIPRVVNKLCDLALVYASSAGQDKAGIGIIRELVRDGLILKPLGGPLLLAEPIDSFGKAAE
jgi:type II secretory pathway predicted ATPase ExeA